MPTLTKYGTALSSCGFRFCAALIAFLVGTFMLVKCGIEYVHEVSLGGMKPLEVPCGEWPTLEYAERALAENAEIVERIEALSPTPNTIKFKINDWKCAGGASLDIWIPGVRQRDAIYEMLGSDTWFFGVPYQLINW